ncbi:MAG TPA: hypothetical protein VFV86_07465 [Nitrososphaeraceae archaeon]|nr:hypothetical protein [Nitrososphaeraceae archaeon]
MSEHAIIHDSLEKCAFELLRRGFIKFDKETKKYYPNEDRIT